MQVFLAGALAAHRPQLRRRWEERLRALPPSSALASPDALVHLMDSTLNRLGAELGAEAQRGPPGATPECRCGLNPLVAYFITAEEALMETLFLDDTVWPALTTRDRERALATLLNALRRIAHADLETFCSLCQRRFGRRPVTTGAGLEGITPPCSRRGSARGKRSALRPSSCGRRG